MGDLLETVSEAHGGLEGGEPVLFRHNERTTPEWWQ
jgi:hypothetical protein